MSSGTSAILDPRIGGGPPAFVDRLRPEERASFAPLLDAWLRPAARLSASADLPLLLGPDADSLRLVLREGERITSHAGWYQHTFLLPGMELQVGLIGAVATAPDRRNRGHAGRLIAALLEHARDLGTDVVVLWSEVEGYYERFGFVKAGLEQLFRVRRGELLSARSQAEVRSLGPVDLPALQTLHRQEVAATRRTLREWHAYLQLPETKYFGLEVDGDLRAYGVVGKGLDLQGCLHEWGGSEILLPALVAGILPLLEVDQLFVMGPPWKDSARRAMADHGIAELQGHLGMLCLPRPDAFCQRLGRPELTPATPGAVSELVRTLFGAPGTAPLLPFYLFGLDSM